VLRHRKQHAEFPASRNGEGPCLKLISPKMLKDNPREKPLRPLRMIAPARFGLSSTLMGI